MLAFESAYAAGRLSDYLSKAEPNELVPGANRLGPPQGDPAIAPAYRDDQLLGFVYLNSDFANAIGYSGKPIQLLVGISPKGVLTGLKLVDHKEPIVLLGIPEKRVVDATNKLIGADMDSVVRGASVAPQVDIVSGATVTVLVMGDSIVRSATKLIKSGRLGNQGSAVAGTAPQVSKTIDYSKGTARDWQSLVGDGSVRRLTLTVADVNQVFEKTGNAAAAARPEEGDPDDTFVDLYVADVAVPAIGRSLLGDDGYDRLAGKAQARPAGSRRRGIGPLFVQGGSLRPRRNLRPHRIDPGDQQHSFPRPRPHAAWEALPPKARPTFPRSRLFVGAAGVHVSIRPNPGCCNCWCSAWSAPGTRPGSRSISDIRCPTST